MPVANPHVLGGLLGPLNTLSLEEYGAFERLDPNDSQAMKSAFRQILLPEFDNLTDESKELGRDSLRYFLSTGEAPFEELVDSQQESPFRSPADPKQFFVCLWEVLFPGESFEVDDLQDWVVRNDHNVLRRRQ